MRLPALHRSHGAGNIAVPFDRRPETGELAALAALGADIFELRLDMAGCDSPEQAHELARAFKGFPLIATARSVAEGGRANDDQMRLMLLAATVEYASAIDIELASSSLHDRVIRMASSHECDLIVSFHHFGATPDSGKLAQLSRDAFALGADVFKIACLTRNEDEVGRLAALLAAGKEFGKKIAAMGMGDSQLARDSRVKLGRAGSFFVFARSAKETAPGQPEIEWLAEKLAD